MRCEVTDLDMRLTTLYKKTNAYVTFETDRAPDYRMGSFYVSSEAGDVEATAALCVERVPFF